jgi:hypothetical protein
VTASDAQRRRDVLVDLIELRLSPSAAIAAVKQLSWDSDAEVARLTRVNAVAMLQRYLRGELSAADFEGWADAVESREDVGEEPGYEESLRAFVFETANPLLAEPISDSYVRRWLERLGGG